MNELEKARQEIDAIDLEMAHLYERRLQAVQKVIQYKMEHQMPILDTHREQEILDRNEHWVQPAYRESYKRFQINVMEESRRFQQLEKENKK